MKAPVTKPPTAELLISMGVKQCQPHHRHLAGNNVKSDEALSSSVATVVNGNESVN